MKKNDENSKSLKDMTNSDEPATYSTGTGSGPDDCMTPEFYDALCKNGSLKSAVYVCGIGWSLPEVSVTGSSSDSGSGSGSGSGSSAGCGSDVFGSGSGSDAGSGSGSGSESDNGSRYDLSPRLRNAISYLSSHALSVSSGKCATHVRLALEAGGISTIGHPVSAKEYDNFLPEIGFREVDKNNYVPKAGDIVVHSPKNSKDYGHIAMYTGHEWISDFVQRDMFGGPEYRSYQHYKIFRYPNW